MGFVVSRTGFHPSKAPFEQSKPYSGMLLTTYRKLLPMLQAATIQYMTLEQGKNP